MKLRKTVSMFLLIFSFWNSARVLAADAPSASFDYPELAVTPRASERLDFEAKKEMERRFTPYLPIQISALTTLTAGIAQSSGADLADDPDQLSKWAGIGVGGGWLAVTLAMALSEPGYVSASREVSALPKGSKREQLIRERLAEEALEKQGRLGCRLKWISFATNAAANVYMLAQSESGSFARVADGVALLVSAAPLVFTSHWEQIAREQADYKKRIYGPVASIGTGAVAGRLAPMLTLSLSF